LGEYLEFREEDVVHYERLSPEQSPPLGSTAVWIKRDCELQHMRTTSLQEQATFLRGDIAQRFRAGTTPGGIPGAGPGEQARFLPPIFPGPTWQPSVCIICDFTRRWPCTYWWPC
jgi:hypothetical protein